MSRFFSFMKKKGDKDGEMPISPPPSPLSKSKSESEGKSVKQVKKRSNKRERRARPAAAAEEGSSVETEPGDLISTDANGNSMTGKVKSSSNANAGEMVLRITTGEGDCDSLGDVDSISEEEIANGKITQPSQMSQALTRTEEASHEKSPGDFVENSSEDIEKSVRDMTNNAPEIRVEKVSSSGTNDTADDLMDDFMNEALDDLETDSPSKDSSQRCDEETKIDGNAYLNGDGPSIRVNYTQPEGNTETSDVGSKEEHFDEHSVVVRPLSTDTAVTHYSSCEPGSDVFDSASEEFHDALQHETLLPDKQILQVENAAFLESDSQSQEDFGEVCKRERKAVKRESRDENDVSRASEKNLEICLEVASQGRTSFLVEDIIEARNQMCEDSHAVCSGAGTQVAQNDESLYVDKPDSELSGDTDRDNLLSKLENSDSEPAFSESADAIAPVSNNENSTLPLNENGAPRGEALRSVECTVVRGDPSLTCVEEVFRGDPSLSCDEEVVSGDPSLSCGEEDSTCGPVVSEQANEQPVHVSVSSHADICSNSETSVKNDDEVASEQVDDVNIDKSVQASQSENSKNEVRKSLNLPGADESTVNDTPIEIVASVSENDTNSSPAGIENVAENNDVNLSGSADEICCAVVEEITTPTRVSSLCSDSSRSSNVSGSGVGGSETPSRDNKAIRASSSSGVSDDASLRSSSRSSFKKQMSLEDELSKYDDQKIKQEAEARLAQRRAARAEARELRLRELEKQQQQNPETNDDASDMSDGGSGGRSSSSRIATAATGTANNGHHHTASTVPPPPPLPHYTRHSSEESNPDDPAASKDIRELEEKFRGAMISNAQLDNEKSQLTYQVELLKDVRADITEQLTQLKKEHKKKCSEHEQLRKVYAKLQEESRRVRRVLEQRDELIQEYGLVVVGGSVEEDEEDEGDEEDLAAREETEEGLVLPRPVPMKRVLLSQEAAEILEKGAAKGSLEWRLRRVVEHKRELEDELRRVNLELEEQVNNQRQNNCLDSNIQKEANKTVNEYKFKVQRAEAEVSSLQANVNRLEVLVTRYKAQVEELEKSEEELKLEKRKLQRERRELQEKSDELESSKNYIKRQYEKLLHDRQGGRH